MKKIFLILIVLVFLSSCVESVPMNIDVFSNKIKIVFGKDYFIPDDVTTVEKDGKYVSYWIPQDMGICCAIHQNKETGIIEKYSVTADKNNKSLENFCNGLFEAISHNNSYFEVSEFEQGDYVIRIFEDTRYKKESENLTLKSEINETNINQ